MRSVRVCSSHPLLLLLGASVGSHTMPEQTLRNLLLETLLYLLEGLVNVISEEESVDVGLADGAALHEVVPVDDGLPVLFAEEDDGELVLDLPALLESHDFEELGWVEWGAASERAKRAEERSDELV